MLVVAAATALAGCGGGETAPDPAAQAARGIVGQMALFCPSRDFSWETFDAAAKSIGAEPDGGKVHKAPTVGQTEIVRERWVALNQSGRRTTVWIAELGPVSRYVYGVAHVRQESGLVCMVHDPGLGREEARDIAKEWEGVKLTGAQKTGPGDLDMEGRQWTVVLSAAGSRTYQDLQMYVPEMEHGGGAMLTRHSYVRAQADATAP